MNSERKIIWEYFQYFNIEEEEIFEMDDDSDEGWKEGNEMVPFNFPKPQPVINTHFGPIRVNDKYNPLRDFEFRMGHTNFVLTAKEVEKIKNVPGIDALKVLSPYRLLVGIGKLFSFTDVRTDIEKVLCNKKPLSIQLDMIEDEGLRRNIEIGYKEFSENYQYWAIYVYPNGKFYAIKSNKLGKEFLADFEQMKECKQLSEGLLLHSDNMLEK